MKIYNQSNNEVYAFLYKSDRSIYSESIQDIPVVRAYLRPRIESKECKTYYPSNYFLHWFTGFSPDDTYTVAIFEGRYRQVLHYVKHNSDDLLAAIVSIKDPSGGLAGVAASNFYNQIVKQGEIKGLVGLATDINDTDGWAIYWGKDYPMTYGNGPMEVEDPRDPSTLITVGSEGTVVQREVLVKDLEEETRGHIYNGFIPLQACSYDTVTGHGAKERANMIIWQGNNYDEDVKIEEVPHNDISKYCSDLGSSRIPVSICDNFDGNFSVYSRRRPNEIINMKAFFNKKKSEIEEILEEEYDKDYLPYSLQAKRLNDDTYYDVILMKYDLGIVDECRVYLRKDKDEIKDKIDQYWSEGYIPVNISSYVNDDDEQRFSVILYKPYLRAASHCKRFFGVNVSEFNRKVSDYSSEGYSVVAATVAAKDINLYSAIMLK